MPICPQGRSTSPHSTAYSGVHKVVFNPHGTCRVDTSSTVTCIAARASAPRALLEPVGHLFTGLQVERGDDGCG